MAIQISGTTVIDDSRNVTNVGLVSATTVSAEEYIGIGDKLIFKPSPTAYNPGVASTDIALDSTISITFDQPVYTSGISTDITLRNTTKTGTIIESFDPTVGTGLSFNGQVLTITPSSLLPTNTTIYVVIPSNALVNAVGGKFSGLSVGTEPDYYFTSVDFKVNTFSPANGATSVAVNTNIALTFSAAPTKGTGTIELRDGSATGTVLESFNAATSTAITIASNTWTLNPTSNLPQAASVFLVMPSGAVTNYSGINVTGGVTYSFTTVPPNVGDTFGGGQVFRKASGVVWIVAPASTERSYTWASRNSVLTVAQTATGVTGWFVPTCSQLQSAYGCRANWDSYSLNSYWSSTSLNGTYAYCVGFCGFGSGTTGAVSMNFSRCVRAFRCVTY